MHTVSDLDRWRSPESRQSGEVRMNTASQRWPSWQRRRGGEILGSHMRSGESPVWGESAPLHAPTAMSSADAPLLAPMNASKRLIRDAR